MPDDVKLIEPDWCENCHAHIVPMGVGEMLLSWACWFLTMNWPDRWFANRAHLAVLPWAGNIAYRCTCLRNQRITALRARGQSQGD